MPEKVEKSGKKLDGLRNQITQTCWFLCYRWSVRRKDVAKCSSAGYQKIL